MNRKKIWRMPGWVFVFSILLLCSVWANSQPVKRLYLANDDHTDYMWTGTEAQYDSAFVHMLDYYMAHIDSTKGNPDDFQARWNCDGSYWLQTYQKFRSPAQFEKLIGHIRTGHISSPLNSLVSCYGGQPAEAVIRGMFYAGKIERQYNLRFPLAVAMENQTLPMGLSSLWAGSGARYSWKGVCDCGSKLSSVNLSKRKHQLYHYKGADNQSVLMKWYNHSRIGGGSRSLGGYAETRRDIVVKNVIENITSRLPEMEAMCDTISPDSPYPYNAVGAFGYGGDDLTNFTSPEFITIATTHSTPFRRIRVSSEEDFFQDIERNYKNIPHQTVTFGNEWDLYCASMNETTAEVRRATEKLRAAESLATLTGLKKPGFASELSAEKEKAWEAFGMFWEHDWTADGPVSRQDRANWQIRQKNYITGYVDRLFEKATAGLGQMIQKSDNPRFYVFNPLSWIRSDYADFQYEGKVPVKVIDVSTGDEVENQLLVVSGKKYLRVWAKDIPAVGYKVFELREGTPAPTKAAATFENGTLENNYYRLEISNSGVITKIYDRRAANRQLVRAEKGRYVNDLGTADLDSGKLTVENSGPVSLTVRAESNDPIPHVTRITVYANVPRIDIQDSITANFGDVKTWAFSFALHKPTTRYEEVGAIATAKKESRGGSYSDQNARYDWQTFNHFANLGESDFGVTISNLDCSFFQLGESTPDSLHEESSLLKALAGGQIDGRHLGIHDQNGNKKFSYQFSLTTNQGSFEAAADMKFSLEHQNPFVAAMVTGSDPVYPAKNYSLMQVTDPNVLLWSLKPSEEGIANGVIARFWNMNEKPLQPVVKTNMPVDKVWQTTHIETNEKLINAGKNRLKASFQPWQIQTFRFLSSTSH